MNQKIAYLPKADRYCDDCGCFKAVARACVRRDFKLLELTTQCGKCGDRIDLPEGMDDSGMFDDSDAHCCECGIGALDNEANPLVRVSLDDRSNIENPWTMMCMECLEAADSVPKREPHA